MPQQLTIGIVTKNRPDKLRSLLRIISRWQLAASLTEIIIIDNSDMPRLVEAFGLPIRYLPARMSVPQARNRILHLVKTSWLGFLDDDCLPEKTWMAQALLSIQHRPDAAYLVGKNELLNPRSYWAQVQYHRHTYWQKRQLLPSGQTIGFHLDTKNCLIHTNLLQQSNIGFDNQLQIEGYDNADTDLGFQIAARGLKGYYFENMRVKHPETEDLAEVWQKAKLRGRLSRKLAEKWHLDNDFVDLRRLSPFTIRGMLRSSKRDYLDFRQYCLGKQTGGPLSIFAGIKLYDAWYRSGYLSK